MVWWLELGQLPLWLEHKMDSWIQHYLTFFTFKLYCLNLGICVWNFAKLNAFGTIAIILCIRKFNKDALGSKGVDFQALHGGIGQVASLHVVYYFAITLWQVRKDDIFIKLWQLLINSWVLWRFGQHFNQQHFIMLYNEHILCWFFVVLNDGEPPN